VTTVVDQNPVPDAVAVVLGSRRDDRHARILDVRRGGRLKGGHEARPLLVERPRDDVPTHPQPPLGILRSRARRAAAVVVRPAGVLLIGHGVIVLDHDPDERQLVAQEVAPPVPTGEHRHGVPDGDMVELLIVPRRERQGDLPAPLRLAVHRRDVVVRRLVVRPPVRGDPGNVNRLDVPQLPVRPRVEDRLHLPHPAVEGAGDGQTLEDHVVGTGRQGHGCRSVNHARNLRLLGRHVHHRGQGRLGRLVQPDLKRVVVNAVQGHLTALQTPGRPAGPRPRRAWPASPWPRPAGPCATCVSPSVATRGAGSRPLTDR